MTGTSVDVDEARRLREFYGARALPLARGPAEPERRFAERIVGRSVA